MRAHGRGAVHERATKRKVHARGHVLRAPIGLAVLADDGERILPSAAHIRRAKPGLPLVEMGVQIGTDRPDHPAVEVDRRQAVIGDRVGPLADRDLVNFAAGNCQRGRYERVRSAVAAVFAVKKTNRKACIDEAIVAPGKEIDTRKR